MPPGSAWSTAAMPAEKEDSTEADGDGAESVRVFPGKRRKVDDVHDRMTGCMESGRVDDANVAAAPAARANGSPHIGNACGEVDGNVARGAAQRAKPDLAELEAPVKPEYVLRVVKQEDGLIRAVGLTAHDKDLSEYRQLMDVTAWTSSTQAGRTDEMNGNEAEKSKAAAWKRETNTDQTNFLSREVMVGLRKKKHPFPRYENFQKDYKEYRKAIDRSEARNNLASPTGPVWAPCADDRRAADLVKHKRFLAPLTTVGNLPFRRVCIGLGANMTCGEMATAFNLLQGGASEWALLRRHKDERFFGVQLAGNNCDLLARAAELVASECQVDFIDLNAACPIDVITKRGAGCSLMSKKERLREICMGMSHVAGGSIPLSVKFRIGEDEAKPNAHTLIPIIRAAGASWVTIHGRSKKQRYSKAANWDYLLNKCAPVAREVGLGFIPNGDVYSYHDIDYEAMDSGKYSTVMVARGALIKPWIFTEIEERRDWDISATERLELYKDFCRFGLDHWGADARGIDRTRKFLLEWMSFACRYVPIGLLERVPITMRQRVPPLKGRNQLETMLASQEPADWVKLSEAMLGPVTSDFSFTPKHKSDAWKVSAETLQENG
ncbi:tRNA-dihydrouridine(47) synthase NAD(P)(+)-like [Porphyridium purpureum]|uniref:tRNA-dihydrouridine(47) synthase [NAD(P)(+)] n=1 Tax=Porphyridium purpureum TaxID=35688 RepID=A0A5J4Z5G4_PORPP|nr:tRNA-dihydrouridine(47) synthase NAD(P)(+)-like [Porphyridium purpureum]|eukprot:POR3652..scf295_1